MDKDGKINLLLIEDDPDFGAALTSRLAKREMNVTRAKSAEEAMEKIRTVKFDVVVADIKLPGMDGVQFLAQVREFNKSLPVILVTGYASLESAKEAVRLAASDYLLKPLESIDELLNSINKAIYSYRLFRENAQLTDNLEAKIHELEQSEHKYKDLFELASDISYIVDENGVIISANKKMEEETGYPARALVGKPFTNFIAPIEDSAVEEVKFPEVLSKKSIGTIEVKVVNKKNKELIGELGMRPIREDGKIIGAQCAVRDITERKKAEQKLQKAYARLIETQTQLIQAEKMEALGRMAGGVAHEVKNPLGVIVQGVNYLENEFLPQRKDLLDIFRMIKGNIKRADDIIRMFLDFSRVSKLEIKPKDINAILQKALKLVQHMVKLEDIKVKEELAKNLPKVLIDEGKVEQVFINIFLNAIQSMHEGGKLLIKTSQIRVNRILANRSRGYFNPGERVVLVEAKDTGIGISKDDIKKVFDPFFTTKEPQEGTGLGLSVTQNIIEMHKGVIEIKSAKDKGTKVMVMLKTLKGGRRG